MKRNTVSFKVNLTALLVVGLALGLKYLSNSPGWLFEGLFNIGLFALAGGLTNWLAIHMLFEKVPLMYGSGVIALRFEQIKESLARMVMQQFFNSDHVSRFLQEEMQSIQFEPESLQELIDYNKIFDGLLKSLGEGNPMMAMAMPFLNGSRAKIIASMQQTVTSELSNPEFREKISKKLQQSFLREEESKLQYQVQVLIEQRVAELSPQLVKQMVSDMIEEQLAWLVIWGALMGALMGLVSSFLYLAL